LTGEITSSDAPDASSDSPSDPIRGFSCTTPANVYDLIITLSQLTAQPIQRTYLLILLVLTTETGGKHYGFFIKKH